MTPEQLDRAREQLAPYGYSLDDQHRIVTPRKGTADIYVSRKGPRWHVRSASGQLYFSGLDLGEFLERFWYARKR